MTAPKHHAGAKPRNPAQRTEQPPAPEAEVKPAPPMPGLAVRRRAGAPGLNEIQSTFGHHDVSAVQAHDNARGAAAGLGALAFAQGTDIPLGGPAPQMAAHEAAHVVQQAQGRVHPVQQQDEAAVQGHPSARGDVGL